MTKIININDKKFRIDFVSIVSMEVEAEDDKKATDLARELYSEDPEKYQKNISQRVIVFEVKGGENKYEQKIII